MKNYKEIKVSFRFAKELAVELGKCAEERTNWLAENGEFAQTFPNLTKRIEDEIKEFNNIINQLKN